MEEALLRIAGFSPAAAFVPASLLGCLSLLLAAPTVHVSEKETVHLRIRCLTAEAVAAPEDGVFRLEPDPERGGSLQFEVRWPDETSTSRVTVIASTLPPRPGAETMVRLDGRLVLPDGRRRESSRDLAFTSSTTALFELARVGEQSLTLAVEAESVRETVFSARPTVGAPVVMDLEVEWLENGQTTSLETNRLSTFVGEAVNYSFRLDTTGVAEALEIRLMPIKIFGDVIQVRAEISGSVPGENSVEVVSRREQWMISRGQGSSLEVATGDPPKGYRFVVTPRF